MKVSSFSDSVKVKCLKENRICSLRLVLFYQKFQKFFFFFWPHLVACGILVPQSGIEPALPAVELWSLNHWTAREVLEFFVVVTGHTSQHAGS